jgi:hypothetical protein
MRFKEVLLSASIITFLVSPACSYPAEPKPLFDPGTEEIIDYTKYGEFSNVGTESYKYTIKDRKGLAAQ